VADLFAPPAEDETLEEIEDEEPDSEAIVE